MRNRLLLLALMVSVLGNAVLFFARRPETVLKTNSGVSSHALGSGLAAAWDVLCSDDLTVFTTNLRAAGIPDELLRAAIGAQIQARFQTREEVLRPKRKLKFWQRDDSRTSMETGLALLDIRREKAKLRTQLLGPEIEAAGDTYSIVPASSRDLVRAIKEDYDTMIDALRNQAGFAPTDGEREQIVFLEREKLRELREHLSAEDIVKLEMRTSPLTERLREALRNFDVTEQEFGAIFLANRGLDRYRRPTPGDENNGSTSYTDQQRQKADQAQIKADLKAALGDERYAAYQQSQVFEYGRLVDMIHRANLPEAAAQQAFALREGVSAESNRIHEDSTLSYEQKHAALKTLAEKTRAQMITVLGAEAGEAYGRSTYWLKEVEKGGAVSFRENGVSIRPLPQDATDDW